MAVGTADFVDAAVRVPARSTTRDTDSADAAAARARFGRDLDAAYRAADTAKNAAQARNAAERARSEDAVAAGRADRDKAADLKAAGSAKTAEAGTAKAAGTGAGASAAGLSSRDGATASSDSATARSDAAASARDPGPARAGAPGEDTRAASDKAAAATASEDETKVAKASEAEDGKAEDAKGAGAALATPVIALVLGAPLPTQARGTAAVPVADGDAAVGAALSGASAGTKLGQIAGRATSGEDGTGDDASPGSDSASGTAAKSDLLAALTDGAAAAATPELAAKDLAAKDFSAKASAGTAAPAPTIAEKAAAAASAPPVPLGQVPMTIGLRSLAGSSEFQIRLNPLELGRVDVTLDIDKDKGTVTTHLVVERVETLAMLQRDAGSLQQALTQAGLDPSQGGITMSLRSDGGSGGETARQGDGRSSRGALPGTLSDAAVAEVAPSRALRGLGGLDIRI